MLDDGILTAPALEEDIRQGKALLLELLLKNAGSVSTRRVREQLKVQGLANAEQVIAYLKFPESGESGEDVLFRHHGRRFYSAEAFRQLGEQIENAAESAEAHEDATADQDDPEPRRREHGKEEARLGRYVFDVLNNLYATDYGPDREYVFDVHNLRSGSEFENVDLVAVHWRSSEIVELVAVEVKLAFTAKLVQQANNYRRFANRVWIAVPVEASLENAAAVLRELDPLLFEYTLDLGLGILACRRAVGRSYEVGPVQWPRRVQPDPLEHVAFLERFRETFEAASVLAPRDQPKFPRTR